jgi:hypothetical protein
VQAMLKDGGISFKCVQSKAWRTDYECDESPSDFMTAGEHFGQLIPAVPKGFVRWTQLGKINERSMRDPKSDRKVYYIYCGDANSVPDTAGWAPFGDEMAAAMKGKRGSQRIGSLRIGAGHHPSVEKCLKENTILVSAGVSQSNFSFSGCKGANLAYSVTTASPDPTPSHTSSLQPAAHAVGALPPVALEALPSRKNPPPPGRTPGTTNHPGESCISRVHALLHGFAVTAV